MDARDDYLDGLRDAARQDRTQYCDDPLCVDGVRYRRVLDMLAVVAGAEVSGGEPCETCAKAENDLPPLEEWTPALDEQPRRSLGWLGNTRRKR